MCLPVVGPQVSGLCGGHHDDGGAAAAKPRGDRRPRVAGRLQHDGHGVFLVESDCSPKLFEVCWSGEELFAGPHVGAIWACERGLMRCPACEVDSEGEVHVLCLSVRENVDDKPGTGDGIAQTFCKQESVCTRQLQVPEQGHRSDPGGSAGGRSSFRNRQAFQSVFRSSRGPSPNLNVGDDHPRNILQTFEQPPEELLGCQRVSA